MTREESHKRNVERIATMAAAKERRTDRQWATIFGCSPKRVCSLREQAGIPCKKTVLPRRMRGIKLKIAVPGVAMERKKRPA